MFFAAMVGLMRQIDAIRKGLPDAHGCNPEDGWDAHVGGACGEMALAKTLDVYWDCSVNTFKSQGDVGGREVRTRSKHDYDLIVRESDPEDRTYWLVTGVAPNFRVHGWIKGDEARRDEWWKNHGGRGYAWFVPQQSLWPIESATP